MGFIKKDFLNSFYDGNYKKLLILPIILAVIFFISAFVYPGIPQGIDLTGGNLLIVRSSSAISDSSLREVIAPFELHDLEISIISSPDGSYGAWIEYVFPSNITEAQALIVQADSILDSDPVLARSLAVSAVDLVSNIISPIILDDSPAKAVSQADLLVLSAKESFNNDIQSSITSSLNLIDPEFQIREIPATLGSTFFNSVLSVGATALVLIIVVIFVFFRKVVPSFGVLLAAGFDILAALGLMGIFGIPLSLSSIPALLMLAGYSVDTDIMLTTRLLKRQEKSARERAADSMKTGLTMTSTTLAAVLAMFIVSYFGQIEVIFVISSVLLFGLVGDVISTWFMNAPILLWYVEKGGRK